MIKLKTSQLHIALFTGIALSFLIAMLLKTFRQDYLYFNSLLHSSMETLGAFIALAMAVLLFDRKHEKFGGKFFSIAVGFLGMGLLTGFHAITWQGNGLILLISISNLLGGFFFSLIYVKSFSIYKDTTFNRWLPLIVAVGLVILAVWTFLFRKTLPAMAIEGKFTTAAIAFNSLGGILFILAGGQILYDYHLSKKLGIYFLAAMSFFFGLSGLMFTVSSLWSLTWWFLHIIRLVAYMLVVAFMYHEFKVADEELKLYRDNLENLVKQRTVELADTNEQLSAEIQVRKLAQAELEKQKSELKRSNEDLEQFAFIASHDLKSPLQSIAAHSQLLTELYKGKLDADADKYIANILDGIFRMKEIIDDLLTYSRVTTQLIAFSSFDSNKAFRQSLVNLQDEIEKSGTEINSDSLPKIRGDPTQICELFQNLIGNAIKYSAPKPKIQVRARKKDNEWIFSVSDNGIGIDPKYYEQIFIVFKRLHNRKEYSGTGVGLAICKKIVERHGGKIWVESEPGKGSTFYFTIPDTGGNHLKME